MKTRFGVIMCLLWIVIGFVLIETLAVTHSEGFADSKFNAGWVENSSPE